MIGWSPRIVIVSPTEWRIIVSVSGLADMTAAPTPAPASDSTWVGIDLDDVPLFRSWRDADVIADAAHLDFIRSLAGPPEGAGPTASPGRGRSPPDRWRVRRCRRA